MMNLYILGLVILCLIAIFFKRTINILNPIVLFCVIWGTMIFLYLIPLFTSFPSITLRKWLIIVCAVGLFCIGALLTTKLFHVQKIQHNYVYNMRILLYTVVALISIVFVAFFVTVIQLGLPPLLGGNINRADYYVSYIEPFYLLVFPFWFLSIYLIKRGYKPTLNVFLILSSLLLVFLKGNKFPLVFFIGLVIFYLGVDKRVKVGHLLYLTLIIIGVFGLSSTFITKATDQVIQAQNIILGVNIPSRLRFVVDPILYFTNNLLNITNFFDVQSSYSYGAQMFSGVFHDLGIGSLINRLIVTNEDLWSGNLQFSWLTTGSYLKVLYLDFGYSGIFIGSLLYGFVCGLFYVRVRDWGMNNTLITLYVYYLLFLSVLLSFFTSYLSENGLIYNFLVIIIIHILSQRRISNAE
ncbi:O-antigen polymerase [Lactiplantibacillus plantarum]|uniref:O-antigen polymerase n=1 Tax=Lactiplantibacillus plantarum TaxID=1590 RepID=UPI002477F199|nr:O-antigen polymerase [Lactiplantibacillus plantarum]